MSLVLLQQRRQGGLPARPTTTGPAAAARPPPLLLSSPMRLSSPSPSSLRRHSSIAPRALPRWLASIIDFESWAPRSSRMWRLDQYSYERSTSSSDEEVERERAIEGLQARVDALRKNSPSPSPPAAASSSSSTKQQQRPLGDAANLELPAQGSLQDVPLTAAGIARLAAGGGKSRDSDEDENDEDDQDDDDETDDYAEEEEVVEEVEPLSSDEIRLLLLQKWGKQYDMAFVRRDLPGAVFCALNVYCNCLEQRSFILTEEQYVEKLSAIAVRLQVLNQTKRVRTFLQQPAKSSKGLPRRPTMGTAVSISLDVTPAQIEAYFTGPM